MMPDEEITALIVVDVQPTFMEGGGLPVTGGYDVVESINRLMNDNLADVIVATQDWHIDPGEHISDDPDFVEKFPSHGIAGSEEAELHPELDHSKINAVLKKGQYHGAFSGFEGSTDDGRDLAQYLRSAGVTKVYVCGLATDFCVKATALDAVKEGFETVVLLGATRGVVKATTDTALDEMDEAGIELDFTGWVEPPEAL